MLYHQNRFSRQGPSGKKNKSNTFLIGVLLLVLLIGFVTPLRGFFAGLLNYMGEPLWIFRDRIVSKVPETANYFLSKNSLYNENNDLKTKINNLEGTMVENEVLREENAELKKLLSFSSTTDDKVLAAVLVTPRDSMFDTLLIGAGRKDGVSVGDYVYANGHFVLGKIIELYQDTSKVQLFSYNDIKTPVLLGKSRLAFDALGDGGQNFTVDFPADVEVSESDVAILSDRQSSILAVVRKIVSTPGGLIRQAILSSPININELHFVEIKIETAKTEKVNNKK